MRLEWLEDLLAVAETGSFREAAERRFLTQSAFSRRIQNIEDHVGTELFDRSRKPVQLRPAIAGRHDQIQRLAMELDQLVADLRSDARTTSGQIILAAQHSLSTTLVPELLAEIRRQDGAIRIRLRSANLDECLGLLLSRQADIIVVYRPPAEEHPSGAGQLEAAMIGTERLIPVFNAGMVDGLRAQMAEGVLPLIAYPINVFFGSMMGRSILPALRNIAIPVPVAETALSLAAIEMAAIGTAVAWVPLSLADRRIASGELTDLSGLLPDCLLEIDALRLPGSPGPVADAAWIRITSGSVHGRGVISSALPV